MLTKFEDMPGSARVWVYGADRAMNVEETAVVNAALSDLCANWKVHGQPISASFVILENRFVALVADESSTSISGCSIDSSVHTLKSIQQKTGIDFLNRSLIPFERNGRVEMVARKELGAELEKGTWNENTITFNLIPTSSDQLRTSWRIRAGDTWLKNYLDKRMGASMKIS